MINPYFYSPSPGIMDSRNREAFPMMLEVGLNTGNMLFAAATQRVLKVSKSPLNYGSTFNPELLSENHDGIVIPAANWLQPRADYGPLAKQIELSGLPCVVVGLGAQTGKVGKIPELTEGTQRFLKVIGERAVGVSVRGDFTAEVLNAYGVKNGVTTGCPSLLYHINDQPILSKPELSPEKIVICGSRGVPSESQIDSKSPTHIMTRLLAEAAKVDDVCFIAQAEMPEIEIFWQNYKPSSIREEWIDFAMRYYRMDRTDLYSLVSKKMNVFFDVDEWLSFLRTKDFVFGTRLHGVIAALLAGKPGLLVVHDSRTAEMAELMNIPLISHREVNSPLNYKHYYDRVDFGRFNKGYSKYHANFRLFFDNNGLNHRLDSPTYFL